MKKNRIITMAVFVGIAATSMQTYAWDNEFTTLEEARQNCGSLDTIVFRPYYPGAEYGTIRSDVGFSKHFKNFNPAPAPAPMTMNDNQSIQGIEYYAINGAYGHIVNDNTYVCHFTYKDYTNQQVVLYMSAFV